MVVICQRLPMMEKLLRRLHIRLIYGLVHLFIFHPSHQAVLPYDSSSSSLRGDRCLVHFGVQSDVPSLIIDAFFDSTRLDRQSVLDHDSVLHGICTEFSHCSAWKTIQKYPPRWMRTVLRQLRCGKAKDGAVLNCCPEIKSTEDSSTIVFPTDGEEITFGETATFYKQHPNRHLLPGLDRKACTTEERFNGRTGRILGGKVARLGQFPWMVRLAYKPTDRGSFSKSRDLDDDGFPKVDFRCGGVLLNDRYVLTAAHCLRDTNDRVFMVRLGELDERSDPDCEHKLLPGLSNNERLVTCADRFVDVPVVQSIVHERFDTPYRQNDIALLRLNTSITPTKWIRPVCLPFDWPSLDRIHTSLNPVLVGWGRDDSFQFAETLQQVRLAWFNTSACCTIYANAHPRSISVSESLQFCLAGGINGEGAREDTCQGDSGGPVLLTDPSDGAGNERVYAVGVISFGPWMCGNGFPSVYTWLPGYLSWILDNIVA